MSTYQEKLQSPKWQKKRLEILEYANWRCQLCGNADEQLHVHHSYYENGKEPWEYPNGALIAVCHTCHETKIHSHTTENTYKTQHEKMEVFIAIPVESGITFLERLTPANEYGCYYHIANKDGKNLCHRGLNRKNYHIVTADLYRREGCDYYFVQNDIPEHRVCSDCTTKYLGKDNIVKAKAWWRITTACTATGTSGVKNCTKL